MEVTYQRRAAANYFCVGKRINNRLRRIRGFLQRHHHIRQPIHISRTRAQTKLQATAYLAAHFGVAHRILRAAFDGVAFEFDHLAGFQREFDARGFDGGGIDRRVVNDLVIAGSAAMPASVIAGLR